MAITYNAGINAITVIGYTEVLPCTFLAIYNADVAGGWGVVTRQCADQFCFDCRIIVGDGITTSWFADTNKHIVITDAAFSALDQSFMSTPSNSTGHIRFGVCIDSTAKTTKSGCSFIAQETTHRHRFVGGTAANYTKNIELYRCSFYGYAYSKSYLMYIDNSKIYNCTFSKVPLYRVNADFCNIQISDNAYDAIPYPIGTYDRLTITECGRACAYLGSVSTQDVTIKNLYGRNNTNSGALRQTAYSLYIINGDIDDWSPSFTLNPTGKIYRRYEFDLKVIQENSARTPIVGATVKIWDFGNSLVLDTVTDANGEIATQTLHFGYYDAAHGSTPVMETPHKIQIRKSGTNFLTVEKYMYMDYKRTEVVSMVDMTDLRNDIAACQTDLDNPNQYKADVSDLEDIKKLVKAAVVFSV